MPILENKASTHFSKSKRKFFFLNATSFILVIKRVTKIQSVALTLVVRHGLNI